MNYKFLKKPVCIEAFQMTQFRFLRDNEWPEWLKKARNMGILVMGEGTAKISTLEGDLHVNYGDWIIKGVHGELYPCKPDIFRKTYEEVE